MLTIQASPKIIQLLEELYIDWAICDQNRNYYLYTRLPDLKLHPTKGSAQEKVILSILKYVATPEQWEHLEEIAADIFTQKQKRQKQILDDRQACEERKLFVATTIQSIHSLLEKYDFTEAEELYAQIKDEYPETTYQQLVQTYKRPQARKRLISSILSALKQNNLATADEIFSNTELLSEEEYLEIKIPYIEKYVQEHYAKSISHEQASALASPSRNLLVSARAGSGKTTVLACKTSLLIDCEQVHPDEILVLAFNKNAAIEICDRIQKVYKQPKFDNARTFHSLAHQLVQPKTRPLHDENDDIATRQMTIIVQQLAQEVLKNPFLNKQAYTFFRKEMREIERAGFLLDDKSYFDFRRNLRQVSLKGEKVKSAGEKYIADYLFEHDIFYIYEKVFGWGSQIYRPDFTILYQQQDFVIEHWGIDEYDAQKRVSPEWRQTWDEYHAEMQKKRAYWKDKSVVLIETSIRDIPKGSTHNRREAFEAILEERLAQAGIHPQKLTDDELLEKIRENAHAITRLAELFTQFIQKAKKQILKPEDIQQKLLSYQPKDEREAVFLEFACRVYLEYERALKRQDKIDFDDLIVMAIDKIHQTSGNCQIMLGHPKNRSVCIKDLRWILIDEFQDFSRLFYELVAAIRLYNPRVRIFCVGDDWQAINGFAGSDLRYFHGFTSKIGDAKVADLLTNFRSQAKIVRTGNALMQGRGQPAEHLPEHLGGDIYIERMDDTWVELRSNNAERKAEDERFLIIDNTANGKKYNHIIASKYLKRCYEILAAPQNQGKTATILNRTNWIDGVRLSDFRSKLRSYFIEADRFTIGKLGRKIDVETVHKYKGLEADLVIILNASEGSFPLLHPDNALFEFFGKTLFDAYEEEERLFYVAVTRAKHSLYILTEEGRESVFLDRLWRQGLVEKIPRM